MTDHYLVPAEDARIELRVANSRFISTIGPAFDVIEARAFVEKIRNEFPDASHNVPAFVIGHGASVIAHSSDDGEPSGTAGRPALAVLQGSDLGDVVVVVTRYFGGTKLGTGGLVRAYGNAVREVIRIVPKAEKAITHTVVVVVPYPFFEQLRLLVIAHHGQILDETFAANVTMTIQFRIERYEGFQEGLRELTHGQIESEIIGEMEETIMPVAEFRDEED